MDAWFAVPYWCGRGTCCTRSIPEDLPHLVTLIASKWTPGHVRHVLESYACANLDAGSGTTAREGVNGPYRDRERCQGRRVTAAHWG
jgi:hypothetical protein